LLELLTEEHYTKSRVAQSGLAILLLVLFAGLLLTLQNVFAEKKVESMDYEYVVCDNGVWYPTGTDCKVALKKYHQEWDALTKSVEPIQNQGLTASTILTLRAICIENSGSWQDYYCGFTTIQNKQNFEQRVIAEGLVDEYQYLSVPSLVYGANTGNTIIIKDDDDDDDNDDDHDHKTVIKKYYKGDGKDKKPVPVNLLTPEFKVSAATNKQDCLSESDDNLYCDDFDWSAFHPDKETVDELCDASEDYAKNPKNCDKAYDLVEEEEAVEKELKKACDADDNAKWTETGCVVDEIEPTEEDVKARAEMTQSESFKKHLESKGIDYDDYDNISAEEQEQIETEFKEDKSDEYEEELNNKEEEDEGKRYVNPDGGAPLYEDELTEDEKDEALEEPVNIKASPEFGPIEKNPDYDPEKVANEPKLEEEEQTELEDDEPTEPESEEEDEDEDEEEEPEEESEE
jgi:hypothetical protein